VLMNLCSNANQAMEETGGILFISLSRVILDKSQIEAHRDMRVGNYFEISVSDTGIGIDPKIADRVFDPFFTTKPVNKGTGMGLATAHRIVKEHGGMITVETKPGKGSCFRVYLPESAPSPVQANVTQESIQKKCEHILLVDDEEPIVRITRKQLESLGYRVTDAVSPKEALRLFQADPDAFDMVITDHTMPKMTGDRLAAEMLRIRPNLPIALCTGYAPKIWNDKSCTFGIRAVGIKPMSRKELAAMVRSVLNTSECSLEDLAEGGPPIFGST
jgi:CheY-like chemotaxis protein